MCPKDVDTAAANDSQGRLKGMDINNLNKREINDRCNTTAY